MPGLVTVLFMVQHHRLVQWSSTPPPRAPTPAELLMPSHTEGAVTSPRNTPSQLRACTTAVSLAPLTPTHPILYSSSFASSAPAPPPATPALVFHIRAPTPMLSVSSHGLSSPLDLGQR